MTAPAIQRRFLSLREAAAWVGVGRSTLLRWEAAGDFPRRVRLGPNRVGWDVRDLETWASDRKAEQ
jgi:prophage regulatory protein